MYHKSSSCIIVCILVLSIFSACSPTNSPAPTNEALLLPTNTIASPAATIPPPTETLVPTPLLPTETVAPTRMPFSNPLIYDIPEMYDVTVETVQFNSITEPVVTLPMDIYYPPDRQIGQTLPAVLMPNHWPQGVSNYSKSYGILRYYEGWGRMIAANGLIAVAYETSYPDDLEAVVKYIQDNHAEIGIDANRLGLFGEVGNPVLAGSFAYQKNREYIRFAVFFSGVPALPDSPEFEANVELCRNIGCFYGELPEIVDLRTDLPIFIVRGNMESPSILEDVDFFIQQATMQGVPLTLVEFEKGHHSWDLKKNTADPIAISQGVRIIQQAIEFMKTYAFAP